MFPKFRCWRLNPQIHILMILRDGALVRKLGLDENTNMGPCDDISDFYKKRKKALR